MFGDVNTDARWDEGTKESQTGGGSPEDDDTIDKADTQPFRRLVTEFPEWSSIYMQT